MKIILKSRTAIGFDAFPKGSEVSVKGQPNLKNWNDVNSRVTTCPNGFVIIKALGIYTMLASDHPDEPTAIKMYVNLNDNVISKDEAFLRARCRNDFSFSPDVPGEDIKDPPNLIDGWLFVRDTDGKPIKMPKLSSFAPTKPWFYIGGHSYNKGGTVMGKYKGLWPAYPGPWEVHLNDIQVDPSFQPTIERLLKLGGQYIGIGQKRTYGKGLGRFLPEFN